MIPLGWKLGIAGVVLVAIVSGLWFAKRHYEGMQDQIASLSADKGKLEVALATEQTNVEQLKGRVNEWDAAYKKLEQNQQQIIETQKWASTETRRLNELFAEHELSRLALAKPGLIERRVNDGTARILWLLECASDPGRQCDTDRGPGSADPTASGDPSAAGPSAGDLQRGDPGPDAGGRLGLHRAAPTSVREPRAEPRRDSPMGTRGINQLAAVQ